MTSSWRRRQYRPTCASAAGQVKRGCHHYTDEHVDQETRQNWL